jgi:homocysteine S-methyltransferase
MTDVAHASLPQLEDRLFLTDSGLETTLIFMDGIDLPEFAAFVLMETADGRRRLQEYFAAHARIAWHAGTGFIAEAPTWRANPDWGGKLGYDRARLDECNRDAIALLAELRAFDERGAREFVISGCVGPRGDGYDASARMSPGEAEAYHTEQIESFAEAEADMVCALTLTHIEEAIGITRAARNAGLPVAISFTVETDGLLPSGASIGEAIDIVDAVTGGGPEYYMLNCAHPTHFRPGLRPGEEWVERIRGIRANASRRSHAELDETDALDSGDPDDLAAEYIRLISDFPAMTILGGCCGTDQRHVKAIAERCVPVRR